MNIISVTLLVILKVILLEIKDL